MSITSNLAQNEAQPVKKPGDGFRGGNNSINRAGRKPGDGSKPTNRELRERELLMLLRKIRPTVADAVVTSAKIMKNEEAADQNRLRAAATLLDAYRKLTLDLYDGTDPEEEGKEIQQANAPVFSLKMINTEEKKV